MRGLKKADLIERIVYMASPLPFDPHAEPHADLMGWLWTYKIATPGVRLGDNPTVRLDVDNEPQPDAVLLIDAQCGGQTCLSDDGYIEGAPEFVAEISASTATIDLRDKKRVYRRNGVKEYLVWQVMNRRIDWFSLQEEEYIALLPDAEGIIRSRVFPGLWLAVSALIDGDMPSAIANLQTGLNSTAHQEFVQQLASFPKATL
ncbi:MULTISPECIES: Uma2 family endonuclease [unclassified Microcoleus]|uniref:Uma2 family endonuclease n=1 Tax=unclassified Microcoleus TaxID=2642155 RepID=UPI002FD04DA4